MTIDPAASGSGASGSGSSGADASGPDAHLDPDLMADLYDGLLDPGAAEAARRHLAGCAACADDFALITMDSGEFAGSPPLAAFATTEPIPAEVAIRIEAALHREPPLTPLAAPTTAPHHTAAPRRTRRFRLLLGSLAGASLVVAGAFAGIAALNGSSENKGAATSTAQRAAGGSSEGNLFSDTSPNGSRVGAAPNAAPSRAPGDASSSHGSAVGPDAAGSGNLAVPNVDAQAEQLLAKAGQSQPQAAGSTGGARTELGPSVCAPAGFQDIVPLAMAPITFQGRAAELLVYPKPADAAYAEVYVVAAGGCAGAASGDVLYSSVIPRP